MADFRKLLAGRNEEEAALLEPLPGDRWNLRVLLRNWLLKPSAAELARQAAWEAEWLAVAESAAEVISGERGPLAEARSDSPSPFSELPPVPGRRSGRLH